MPASKSVRGSVSLQRPTVQTPCGRTPRRRSPGRASVDSSRRRVACTCMPRAAAARLLPSPIGPGDDGRDVGESRDNAIEGAEEPEARGDAARAGGHPGRRGGAAAWPDGPALRPASHRAPLPPGCIPSRFNPAPGGRTRCISRHDVGELQRERDHADGKDDSPCGKPSHSEGNRRRTWHDPQTWRSWDAVWPSWRGGGEGLAAEIVALALRDGPASGNAVLRRIADADLDSPNLRHPGRPGRERVRDRLRPGSLLALALELHGASDSQRTQSAPRQPRHRHLLRRRGSRVLMAHRRIGRIRSAC